MLTLLEFLLLRELFHNLVAVLCKCIYLPVSITYASVKTGSQQRKFIYSKLLHFLIHVLVQAKCMSQAPLLLY